MTTGHASASSAASRVQPRHLLMTSVCTSVLIVGAMVGALLSAGSDTNAADRRPGGRTSDWTSQSDQSPEYVGDISPCTTPVNVQIQSANQESSGLVVTTTLLSTCASGDLIANDRFRLTAVDDAGRDVAAGVFDLSSTPIVVPGDDVSTTVTFTFPAGTYWRTPGATNGALTFAAHREGAASSPSAGTTGASAVTAIDVGAPEHGSLDAAAFSALVDIVASDLQYIDSNLLEVWQPQLSSKRPGLYYEGVTWQANDIVREHMQLRQRYPDAKLVWSGDWPVYRIKDWWITVSGIPMSSGAAANDWCASEGWDADHCFAKMLSHRLGESGTTMNR
ncbi:hypothetical protein [Mycobacterium sp. NPDC050041]|uniref:hypothetical protein n=1 Tax=Mycobacterium sp. NPDC050041 TaxID=3364293 RepID=UPI003C2EF708